MMLRLRGTVTSRSEAASLVQGPGDAALVIRDRPRLLVLGCPCGCGELLPINLDGRAGPAWRLYRSHRGTSLYPSVWRETGCESHFIVWRDMIVLFGKYDFDDASEADNEDTLRRAILDVLKSDQLLPYAALAETLQAVPWDVLAVCRRLVREGVAREGAGKQRDSFGLP